MWHWWELLQWPTLLHGGPVLYPSSQGQPLHSCSIPIPNVPYRVGIIQIWLQIRILHPQKPQVAILPDFNSPRGRQGRGENICSYLFPKWKSSLVSRCGGGPWIQMRTGFWQGNREKDFEEVLDLQWANQSDWLINSLSWLIIVAHSSLSFIHSTTVH